MKKMKIQAKNQQKIENCAENLQKTEENSKIDDGVAQMIFWDLLPQVIDVYNVYYDYLSLMFSKTNLIIEDKNNGKRKKETGK